MDEEHVRDLLGGLGLLGIRKMFGGLGVYGDGGMFALVARDELYIKGDEVTEPAFREAGCRPFTHTWKDGRVGTMRYWSLPDAALDDPEEAARWGRLGLEAARRAASRPGKPAAKRPARRTKEA